MSSSVSPSGAPMDARSFDRALAELKATFSRALENPHGFNLTNCRGCSSCMFCTSCEHCHKCTHCESCTHCTSCTQCSQCEGCHQSAYCVKSKRCIGSKYLELCESCTDCTYCFGCVGIAGKEFHVLNEPYDRKTYFEIVKQLRSSRTGAGIS